MRSLAFTTRKSAQTLTHGDLCEACDELLPS